MSKIDDKKVGGNVNSKNNNKENKDDKESKINYYSKRFNFKRYK